MNNVFDYVKALSELSQMLKVGIIEQEEWDDQLLILLYY